jgi:hypothetical protein
MKPWQLLVLGLVVLVGGSAMAGFIDSISPTPGDVPQPDLVQRIAEAIANAEGFYVANSIPSKRNNPGNLTDPTGAIRSFPSTSDGWSALFQQISLILYGGSQYYTAGMTIAQVSYIYANGQYDPQGAANWARNVSNYLGVSTDTPMNQLT